MKIAVVGATGMVGQVMLEILENKNIDITELIPVASEKSVGKTINFKGKAYQIRSLEEAVNMKPTLALFSAGGKVSKEWAPRFVQQGTVVIDNSSTWRMDVSKKLVVPEINADVLTSDDKIIANPNCSTIQLVMVLAPLHKQYTIKRIVVSTYQSVTGTGVKAVQQLENEYQGIKDQMAYKYPIHRNAIPQCDVFEDNGYTKEEMKLVNETKKILDDNSIKITATAVRVPIVGGHSESVNIEFDKDFDINELRTILHQTPGVVLQDNIDTFTYPMPIYAQGKDEVFVGRIRRDYSNNNTVNMWIVADNLRKGAATNTVQIAEYMINNNLV
ncbi:MAG: aspartate-semialdehyde dehydrogenase [Bacteroidota bacterium]|nr:aspartate-semialdehyde dehydrogenase [Bacteroidota bacterium]